MDELSRLVSITPIICSPSSAFAHEEVFGIVDVFVRSRLDSVYDLANGSLALRSLPWPIPCSSDTYARFQVDQDGTGDVSRVIRLIEEHIFPVPTLCRKVLQIPILAYAMLLAQLLPKLTTNCKMTTISMRLRARTSTSGSRRTHCCCRTGRPEP